jgi:hypothetical protein
MTQILRLKFGCQAWTRTKIISFRGMCPTIRRSDKINNFYLNIINLIIYFLQIIFIYIIITQNFSLVKVWKS